MSIPQTVTKTQATGNDFIVYVDEDGSFNPTAKETAQLCNRHFGIGADGLIRLTHPEYVTYLTGKQREAFAAAGVTWFMDYRNADGSLAQMCGNGTRAITRFAIARGIVTIAQGDSFQLGTRAGIKKIEPLGAVQDLGEHVLRVDMGAWKAGTENEYTVTVADAKGSGPGTYVDMGNPHVVTVVEDAYSTLPVITDLDLERAPLVTPVIDEGQNVEFARIDEIDAQEDEGEATMRVYERGCGETMSCGTGVCATAIVLRMKTGVDHWIIHVPGGTLRADVTDSRVLLTGDAQLVADVTLLNNGHNNQPANTSGENR